MAYRPKTINVLDLRAGTGIGVSIPFNQPTVFKTVYTTHEQIKYNLINYLLTVPGERVFELEFGLGLRNRLFEQIDEATVQDLYEEIKTGVEYNFPSLKLTTLSITPTPDENELTILLSYSISNEGVEDQITISLENV